MALVGLVAVFGAVALALTSSSESSRADAAGWSLSWSDEFDSAAGTLPDPTKWGYRLGGDGYGNSERQYYTDRPENVSTDGSGNLAITARKETLAGTSCWYGSCQYTSGRVLTKNKFTQRYGRFESRMKLPAGQGVWPAFWMQGDDSGSVGTEWPARGEIDVMENVGFEPSSVHGSLHGPGYSGGAAVTKGYTLPGGAKFSDAFHTFAVEWAPNVVRWYVDDVLYQTRTPADLPAGSPWVYDHPFYMLLNFSVGGQWPGDPSASTVFPQSLLVDYVRVYSASSSTASTASPTTAAPGTTAVPVATRDASKNVEAESWDCAPKCGLGGVATRSSDGFTSGGYIGGIANGDWVRYDGVATPVGSDAKFAVRVASGSTAAGTIELHADSPTGALLASVPVSNTGGWHTWTTLTAAKQSTLGTKPVYLVFKSGQSGDFVNVDWFKFTG